MKRPDQLTNYIPPNASNVFGRIKDTVYSAPGVVSEVGSRLLADWMMDLLSIIYFIAARRGISLNGTPDDTSSCQAYDILFAEVTGYITDRVNPAARQLALSIWDSSITAAFGPQQNLGENYFSAAQKDGKFVFLYIDSTGNPDPLYSVVVEDNLIDGQYPVTTVGSGVLDGYSIAANDDVFCITFYRPSSFSPICFTSSDGENWTQVTVDPDTNRGGGHVIERFGDNLMIVAYDDPNNSYYTSDDDGQTWARGEEANPVTPRYKPIASAANGNSIVWVDEAGIRIREWTGTEWKNSATSGGSLADSTNKQVAWGGSRYIIRDNSTTLFISRVERDPDFDILIFDAVQAPEASLIPTLVFGGNGVFCLVYTNRVYVATEAEAAAGNWERVKDLPTGALSASLAPQTVAFDGVKHCMMSPEEIAGRGSILSFSAPVKLV